MAENQNHLIPLSAVSFEPDGAEVLILDENNRTKRMKISYGDIIADSLEVLDGIEKGDRLIQFYNRVGAGTLIDLG